MFGFTKRPLFLIAWKNLKTYPVRIFLTTSSIILGVAVIIASNIFSESNKSAFDNLFTGIYEGVDLVVQPIQEDFAQITNKTKETHGESYKYEGSYLEIGELIKKFVPASMIAIENFFKLVLFNYVFSNGDAHLKNFSLVRNEFAEMELSPSYDLMSTIIHTPGERDTALDLYDKDHESEYYDTYGHYGRTEFIEFAKRLGIVEVRYMRIINEFIENDTEVNDFIQNSSLSNKALESFSINYKSRSKRLS